MIRARLTGDFIGQLLQASSRRLPFWASVLLAALIAYYLARLTWLLLSAPSPPSTDPLPPVSPATRTAASSPATDVEAIVAAHLFGKAGAAPAARQTAPVDAPDTRLNLKLRGVVANSRPEQGFAIIDPGNGEEKVFGVGDAVASGVTLNSIYSDRVILNRAGILETLRLPRDVPQGTPQANAGARTARAPTRPSVADTVKENAASLSKLIRAQPYFESGSLRGYRVYPGSNRQAFSALGLQPGDLVTEINGTALNDPASGAQVLNGLDDAQQVTVTVERNGAPEYLVLDTSQLDRLTPGSTQ